MLNMSQINDIRDLDKKGYRISEISEKTGKDPKTIRKYLQMDDFSPKPPVKNLARESIVSPFRDKILGYFKEDEDTWGKQHHTAVRIFKRLRDEEGFKGSYDSVQKYVKRIREEVKTKGTLELVWEAGYGQVDFGEADMYENAEKARKKYLAVSFPYSNDGYTQVFNGETAECVCQGLQDIFQYIGGVPRVLVFDNATGVGRRTFDKIRETKLFSQFRAHYGFQVRFCNPRAGHEKGSVENKVGTLRRNIFVPLPRFHDIEEFNAGLLKKHEEKAAEKHYKKGVLISELFEEDRKNFLPLPRKPFNVCRYETFQADGYGKICIDAVHHYSTKPENSNQKVIAGIRAHYVDILNNDGSILVRHKRQYGKDRTDSCEYSTTLDMLTKNIGAWGNSGVRMEAPAMIREYIDGQEKSEQKATLRLLSELTNQYTFETAMKALEMAIQSKSVNKSDAAVLAARIAGYGIDTPPEAGPCLRIYDDTFLHLYREEKEVAVQ